VDTPPPNFGKPQPPPESHTNAPYTNSPPLHTNPPPVRLSPPTDHYNTSETWIPLEAWCHANGISAPRRSVVDGEAQYSFVTSNGIFVIRIGSQTALWRGMQLHLGFAPQQVNGHAYLHTLDIRKNLRPLLEEAVPTRPRVIVIDAGHGGTDVGTKNVVNGHFEKEYTLDWARRLEGVLKANGCTVYLTRNSDVTMNHFDRVTVAEDRHADVFVSLHFNSAFPDHEQLGLETYCLTPRGMPSNETRGYRDEIGTAFPGNAFDAENLRLAFRLHHSLLNVNGRADRGVRRMRFPTVLQLQNRPSALIEGGYMSNPKEARRIADPAYRQRLAEAVAGALLEDALGVMNHTRPRPAAAKSPTKAKHE
jgi:N-acetylmuramoyl-L-alanine amidase